MYELITLVNFDLPITRVLIETAHTYDAVNFPPVFDRTKHKYKDNKVRGEENGTKQKSQVSPWRFVIPNAEAVQARFH